MDFLRKNIEARIIIQIALRETVKVMEDKITLNWQSQNIVCYIIHTLSDSCISENWPKLMSVNEECCSRFRVLTDRCQVLGFLEIIYWLMKMRTIFDR